MLKLDVFPDIDLVLGVVSGDVDLDLLIEIERRQRNHPAFEPGLRQLLFFANDCRVVATMDEVRGLATRAPIYSETSKRAFVLEGQAAFGTARMFEQIRAEATGSLAVVRTLKEGCLHLDIPVDEIEARLALLPG